MMSVRRAFLRAMIFGLAGALLLASCNHRQEEGYYRSQGTRDGGNGGGGGGGDGGY